MTVHPAAAPSVDVVICTYTADRWDLLVRAVDSALGQSQIPRRLVICVDHNPELLDRCRQQWGAASNGDTEVVVVANAFDGRLGSARNTAVLHCTSDVIAFLDDDACADGDWLETLLAVYRDPQVIAVGGAPRPDYGAPRPAWFPPEFDWVFGCHYRGLPEQLAPVRHLIGANMSVRRAAIVAQGGFHADNHDDMDLSHRIAHAYGPRAVVYEPRAVVRHYVEPARLSWTYFRRRCFVVNRGKVTAFADMGEAGNIGAEVRFGVRLLGRLVLAAGRALIGRTQGASQAVVAAAGLLLAAAGYVTGRVELALGRRQAVLTEGLPSSVAVGADREAVPDA